LIARFVPNIASGIGSEGLLVDNLLFILEQLNVPSEGLVDKLLFGDRLHITAT